VNRHRIQRVELVLIIGILAVGAFARAHQLRADPPSWSNTSHITDEGWWADAARGKLLFDDFFADDFGTAFVVTPGYTYLALGVLRVSGLSFTSIRAIAAFSSLLLVAGVYLGMRDVRQRWLRLLAPLLVALSPFAVVYGRLALIEPAQAAALLASFLVLHRSGRASLLLDAAAGALLGLAVAFKPNAVTLGGVPIVLSLLAGAWYSGFRPVATAVRRLLERMAAFGAGAAAVVLVFFAPIFIQQSDVFLAMARAEAEVSQHSWVDFSILPFLFGGDELVGPSGSWVLATRAPGLLLAVWAALLVRVWRGSPQRSQQTIAHGRRMIVGSVWALSTFLLITATPRQPDHRWVLLIAPLAVCWPYLAETVSQQRHLATARMPLVRRFALWSIVLLPAVVYSKPVFVNWIMSRLSLVDIGASRGLGFVASASVHLGLALAAVALIALVVPFSPGRLDQSWAPRAGTRRAAAIAFFMVLLSLEGIQLVGYYRTATFGTAEAVAALRGRFEPGDVVLGHAAGTLCFETVARTVRRSRPEDLSPPPNPDIWERAQPRFILDHRRFDYQDQPGYYSDLIARHDYVPTARFSIGPPRNGRPRYTFVLYERTAAPTAIEATHRPTRAFAQSSRKY
jgi:hypothetical protein